MANLDAVTVGRQAVRLGLVTPEQIEEALEEYGDRGGEAEPFLRLLERKGQLTPWQSQKILKGETEGYFLGGYRILYKIASGSFGRVYRADDPATGTVVAIKVLRSRWSEHPKSVELFEREGKVGMTMKHPNIVEILAVKCDPKTKQFYIVMEFVEGGNLRDFLRIRKKLEPAEALAILEDAAAGLAYSYSRGISHRDMKLSNVLISSQGRAKLVDFGLAGLSQRLHKDETKVDRTVDYAGLEKATGAPHGDIRSDIYFLGCVAYELLTGRSPLEKSKNPHERMRSQRFRNVQPMSPDEVKAPPSVFRLVEKMMALNPAERYQTPSQLLEAIRDVRRELEGKAGDGKAPAVRSLFILEKDLRLQDKLRDHFKKLGFRVLIAAEPTRAVERFRQQPFDALVLDAGTVGDDSVHTFDHLMREAQRQEHRCAGVVILSEHQARIKDSITPRPNVAVLVRPVSAKQLQQALEELLAADAGPKVAEEAAAKDAPLTNAQ